MALACPARRSPRPRGRRPSRARWIVQKILPGAGRGAQPRPPAGEPGRSGAPLLLLAVDLVREARDLVLFGVGPPRSPVLLADRLDRRAAGRESGAAVEVEARGLVRPSPLARALDRSENPTGCRSRCSTSAAGRGARPVEVEAVAAPLLLLAVPLVKLVAASRPGAPPRRRSPFPRARDRIGNPYRGRSRLKLGGAAAPPPGGGPGEGSSGSGAVRSRAAALADRLYCRARARALVSFRKSLWGPATRFSARPGTPRRRRPGRRGEALLPERPQAVPLASIAEPGRKVGGRAGQFSGLH